MTASRFRRGDVSGSLLGERVARHHPEMLYGGVETGGTWTVCALGTAAATIIAERRFPTGAPQETVDRIVDFFESHERPQAIGVGAFGPIDVGTGSAAWGRLGNTSKPAWHGASLAGPLQQRLSVPIALDTDVNAAALAEQRLGAGRGDADLLYVTIGTGIGAGVVHDGRPWHGRSHPEAGHIWVPRAPGDEFGGSCPIHGACWEGLAAGGAITARTGLPAERIPDDHPIWLLEARYVALGVHALIAVLAPHRVVLGGGVLRRSGLLDAVRRELIRLDGGYLAALPMDAAGIHDYVVAPALDDHAGVLGAIALAQDLAPDARADAVSEGRPSRQRQENA